MFNSISYIKDIIDILRDPPGNAVAAMKITPTNRHHIEKAVTESYGPKAKKYVKNDDYYLEFENGSTIVPSKEFFKHFRFLFEPEDEINLVPVITIKPI